MRFIFFLYSDISSHQIAADSLTPLLRTIQIPKAHLDFVTLNLDKVHYNPVSKYVFDEILIELKMDQNRNIKFKFGKSDCEATF